MAFDADELPWPPKGLGRLVDVVLAAPERLAANVFRRHLLPRVVGLLAVVSLVAAVPYGCALGVHFWWRIPVLFLGSTLICLPSLHVFGSYLGMRLRLAQNVTLALTIPAVAAMFSLGFTPILAFLRWTITPDDSAATLDALAILLLVTALAAGVGQLWRCVASVPELIIRRGQFLLVGWHAVFLYVVVRMARVLELTA
jgi:hypothetical protein